MRRPSSGVGDGELVAAGGKSHTAADDAQGDHECVRLTFDLSSECLHVDLHPPPVSDTLECCFIQSLESTLVVKCEVLISALGVCWCFPPPLQTSSRLKGLVLQQLF